MGPPTIGGGALGAPIPPPDAPGLQGTIGQAGTMPMPPDANPPADMPMRTMPVGPPMSAPPMSGQLPNGGDFPGEAKPPVVFPPQMQGFRPNAAGDAGRGMAAKRALMDVIRSTGSQGRG
jgi:hypothetical protein